MMLGVVGIERKNPIISGLFVFFNPEKIGPEHNIIWIEVGSQITKQSMTTKTTDSEIPDIWGRL